MQWPADGSMSPPIYGDGSGQALPCIKGDAIDEAPSLTAEQVIIKLLRQLRTKAPHYREDVEALEDGRAWLAGKAERLAREGTHHGNQRKATQLENSKGQ